MQFSDFNMGDVIKVTDQYKKVFIGKVIALNPADKSVALINPDTKAPLETFYPYTVIRQGGSFEIMKSSVGIDDDVVNAQARIGVWVEKFNRFSDLVKAGFPKGYSGALTSESNIKLNQASKMRTILEQESLYLPFSAEQRSKIATAFAEISRTLMAISTEQMVHADQVVAIYNFLLFIPETVGGWIGVSGKYFADMGKDFWDWLLDDWKRMAGAIIVSGGVLTAGYLYLRGRK